MMGSSKLVIDERKTPVRSIFQRILVVTTLLFGMASGIFGQGECDSCDIVMWKTSAALTFRCAPKILTYDNRRKTLRIKLKIERKPIEIRGKNYVCFHMSFISNHNFGGYVRMDSMGVYFLSELYLDDADLELPYQKEQPLFKFRDTSAYKVFRAGIIDGYTVKLTKRTIDQENGHELFHYQLNKLPGHSLSHEYLIRQITISPCQGIRSLTISPPYSEDVHCVQKE